MRISLPHVMSTSVLLTFMVGAVVSLTSSVPPHPSLQPVIKAAVVTGNKELITTHAPARTFLTVSLMLVIHADDKTFPDNVQKRLFFASKNFCMLKLPVQSISVIFVFCVVLKNRNREFFLHIEPVPLVIHHYDFSFYVFSFIS